MNPYVQVGIRVASDKDAARISAVLVALGYVVTRDTTELSPLSRIALAANQIADRYRLGEHERYFVHDLLAGHPLETIAARHKVRSGTFDYRMHCIYTQTSTHNLAGLLLLGLRTLAGEPT